MAGTDEALGGLSPARWDARKPRDKQSKHARYDFIDQFRGMVVFFLVVSFVTIQLSFFGLSPLILTHGHLFQPPDVRSWNGLPLVNQPFTWIDLGVSAFMFIVGVSMAIASKSRLETGGAGSVVRKLAVRALVLVAFQVVLQLASGMPLTYRDVLLGEHAILSRLAAGSFVTGILMLVLKEPKRRLCLFCALLGLHGTLHISDAISVASTGAGLLGANPAWLGNGTFFDYFIIPYELVSFIAIGIAGSCCWDLLDPVKPSASVKRYHLPIVGYSLVACFCVVWFIPISWPVLSVSQDLLAIGCCYFFFISFLAIEREYHYKFPFFTALGRNALVVYIAGNFIVLSFDYLGLYSFLSRDVAWLGLPITAGTACLLISLAWVLNKEKVYIRF